MASLVGKTILIIDDSPNVLLLVRKILETDGAQVFEASSVEQALPLIASQGPHLILSDLMLPGKSGFDLLAHRIQHNEFREIPMLVLSSLNDKASIHRAISIGVTDYILKPIQTAVLLSKVRKALQLRSFLSVKFEADAQPHARIAVPAELLEISEIGFKLESPVKLSAHSDVDIKSAFLGNNFRREEVRARTTASSGEFIKGGRYLSEVNFVGIDETFSRAMRTLLGGWK